MAATSGSPEAIDPIDWIIRQDTNYTRIGGCNDNKIIVDGGVVFGAGAGQIKKGEAPEAVSKIVRGIDIAGDDNLLEIDLTRTAGWNGITMRSGAERNALRINTSQHGTPFHPDGNDFGDTIWIDQDMAESTPMLFDGGTTGRDWDMGGHSVGCYPRRQAAHARHSLDGLVGLDCHVQLERSPMATARR